MCFQPLNKLTQNYLLHYDPILLLCMCPKQLKTSVHTKTSIGMFTVSDIIHNFLKMEATQISDE